MLNKGSKCWIKEVNELLTDNISWVSDGYIN